MEQLTPTEQSQENPIRFRNYLMKSVKWVIGNTLFGLLPLWFIYFLFVISRGKVASSEIDHIIEHDAAILFVCCGMMGAVLWDFMLAGIKLKMSVAFRLFIVPGFVAMVLFTDQVLILLKAIDNTCFNLRSYTTIIIVVLTISFTIFTKANLYVIEDTRNE